MSNPVHKRRLAMVAASTALAGGAVVFPMEAYAAPTAPGAQIVVTQATAPSAVCVHKVWSYRDEWRGNQKVRVGYWKCVS